MGRFFDRINFVKRRRAAKAQSQQQQARVVAAFDEELREFMEERLATPDPVARYIALSDLPRVFEARCGHLQEQEFKRLAKKSGDRMMTVMKCGGVAGVGMAVGFGLAFGPAAALFGAFAGALVAAAPGVDVTGDPLAGEREAAARFAAPFRDCVDKYRAEIGGLCARLEDEHLDTFAASKEWSRLTVINPGLYKKASDAFRASVAKRADAPPATPAAPPPAPPQKGFSL